MLSSSVYLHTKYTNNNIHSVNQLHLSDDGSYSRVVVVVVVFVVGIHTMYGIDQTRSDVAVRVPAAAVIVVILHGHHPPEFCCLRKMKLKLDRYL
jgi:hypothetical protein